MTQKRLIEPVVELKNMLYRQKQTVEYAAWPVERVQKFASTWPPVDIPVDGDMLANLRALSRKD